MNSNTSTMNVNVTNEDDEAMDAASNVMETTTNSSSTGDSAAMDDAVASDSDEDNGAAEKEVTMEDAASNEDDTPMGDEDENEEMAVVAPSTSGDKGDEVDEPMEDKSPSELKEETMKTQDSFGEVKGQIPKKMSSETEEQSPPTDLSSQKAKTTVSPSSSLSLHDCLSLGEVELGLENQRKISKDKEDDNDDDTTATDHQRASLEIQRLPYVLHLLSSTRPLASISIMDLLQQNSSENDGDQKQPADSLVDGVVDSLEDVAATYSIAEAVDVVTNHLAPSLTKKISRVKPLRHTSVDGVEEWDTAALADVARDPITLPAKRKRGLKKADTATASNPEGGTMLSSDDAASGDDKEDEQDESGTSVPLKKRKQAYRRDSMETAAEDSQEATFTKTLAELASLVVRSLNSNGSQNPEDSSQQAEDDHQDTEGKETRAFALRTDDSILSEHFRGANEGTGGAMEGSDLGSTVSAIMYHAPVLRSKYVASALCRASLQQTGDLLSRLAANCPASTPALLSGCIETYSMAIKCKNIAIADTAKECVTALAKLSHTECTRVYCKLQSSNVMLDVQLQLATELGSFQLSCLVAQHLSPSASVMGYNNDSNASIPPDRPPLERQQSRESSTDIPDADHEDLNPTSRSDCSEPTLLFHLSKNQELYAKTLGFFGDEFSNVSGTIEQSQGKRCLTLRSLALLLLVPLNDAEIAKKMHQSFVKLSENFCIVLRNLNIPAMDESVQPDHARTDNIYSLFSSCGILLIARVLNNVEPSNNEVEKRMCKDIFVNIKRLHATSKHLDRVWISIDSAIKDERTHALLKCATGPVSQSLEGTRDESILFGLRSMCRMAETQSDTTHPSDLFSRAAALLQAFHEGSVRDTAHVADTKELLREILQTNTNTGATLLVRSIDILRFVVEGTMLLDNEETSPLPFVLPANLEKTWSKIGIKSDITATDPIGDDESIYLLRLLYSLEYLDGNGSALFSVDPWSLPVKEAVAMVRRLPSKPARCFLLAELRRLVRKHCPDLNESACFANRTQAVAPFDSMSREKLIEALYLSIRTVVNKEVVGTGDDNDVEFLFLQARSRLCDADVYCTVSSACLSSPHNPTPRYSYSLLCRDPLVVLRYPLAVWSNSALRSILLATLRALMLAHNSISLKESPTDASADELLVARDAIIVRCLLAVAHGGDSENAHICSATTNFLRWLISSRPGIVGLLVKQGLGDMDVDWLVENVPETMNDAQSLLQVLSEKSCLTASERLAVADAVSRIAIVHGGDFNDQEAAGMTAGALSQLVDSFYLILGPVGVPVNALLSDDSGTDVTQSSRKAAFRILKALIRVRGRRQAFQVCATGLQKLASLCKGESSSVQGAVAAKRKQFLKEVFDTASKAVGISGSAVS